MRLVYLTENRNVLTVYHGTPFEKNAIGIKKEGLQQVGDFIPSGGADGSLSMEGRSYISKDLWNAVRYSFYKPLDVPWSRYIQDHPYGYVFEFKVAINDLLPDEDGIGSLVANYLNHGNYKFLGKYLGKVNSELLGRVKQGEFNAIAEVGKLISPLLELEDARMIVAACRTATVDKPIFPVKSYKIKKPNVQFFKTKDEYTQWFNGHAEEY